MDKLQGQTGIFFSHEANIMEFKQMFYLVIVNKMNSGGLKSGSVCLHSIITERQLRIKSLQRLLAILHWTITGL